MSATQISSYYAKFGFKIDTSSVTSLKRKVSEVKDFISKQLSLNVKITKFSIGKRELNRALKEAIAESGGVHLPINSFKVNAVELRKSVQKAFSNGVILNVNAVSKGSSTTSKRSPQGVVNTGRNSLYNSIRNVGLGSLASIGAGYGIMGINQRSEDLQSSKVSLNTITGGRGVDAYQWLKDQSNAMGFDYSNQLPVFSNYLGASINKQGYENSLTSYKDLISYGTTRGADKIAMERAMLAIGQMWSKGKIMAEELNQQLTEAKGFSGAKAVIAQAYQESIGGKLTGQKAEAALIEAMKKGLVETAKVMPIATRIFGEQAAGGIDQYLTTTGAQHNRFRNAITSSIAIFGKGGFDEGMMRFFKFMADFLEKHSEDIRNLGKSFLDLEKAFERIVQGGAPLTALLVPLWALFKTGVARVTLLVAALDDFSVFVQGGDSVLGQFSKWLKDIAGSDFNAIAVGIGVIGAAITVAFSPMLASIAGLAAVIEAYKYIQGIRNSDKGVMSGQTTLPSWEELDAQNAKNSNWGAFETLTGGYSGGGINTDKLKGKAILLGGSNGKQYRPALEKIRSAFDRGLINQDSYDRALTVAGAGYMTPEALSSWISQDMSRRYNPNIFPSMASAPIEIFLNGTFDNQKVNLNELLGQFPDKSSQPKDQVPNITGTK